MLTKCDYCDLLRQRLTVIVSDLEKNKSNPETLNALLLEMRAYYSIQSEFLDQFANKSCNILCYEKIMSFNTLKHNYFRILSYYGQEPDTSEMGCYICKYLPNKIFCLLDETCSLKKEQELHQINIELQFHVFLLIVSEKMMNSCQRCDSFVNYRAIASALTKYLDNQNIAELNQFVYAWKFCVNLDNILACNEKVKYLERPSFSQVDLSEYITYYLDFNVYDRYEKLQDIKESLDKLSDQETVRIVYSLSHLEEITRMNNSLYENKRLEAIQNLTKGYMEFGDKNDRIAFYSCDINSFYAYAQNYVSINDYAEVEECIRAELTNKTILKQFQEKYSTNIGNKTLIEIVANARKMQSENKNYERDLPSIEDMNCILGMVGIDRRMIDEYEELFVKKDLSLHELRISILSLSRLMYIIGLHRDKINKKDNRNAVYPIYGKESFRKVRSSYYDIDHMTLASKCTFFVTCDNILFNKAKDIYSFLGIKTQPILLKDLIRTEL